MMLALLVAIAALDPVADFGDNPGNLAMFEHVPPNAASPMPLVLVLHGCTEDHTYADAAGLVQLADESGVALVVAETNSGNNANRCFNWFEEADIERDSGEAASLAHMIDKMKASHSIDASKVFVTGLSAGAAMTAVMLADYPDVFAAGAILAGIPYRCGVGLNQAFMCMSAPPAKSQEQWAALVPSSSSPPPRVSVWAGTSDHTVSPTNADDLVLQWTGVHGLSSTPTSTGSLGSATRDVFGADANGLPLVESVRIPGMDHGTPVDPADGCGTAGAFILDVNICSSRAIFQFFGIAAAGPVTGEGEGDVGAGEGEADAGGEGEGEGEGEGGLGVACGCASSSGAPLVPVAALLLLRPRRRRRQG